MSNKMDKVRPKIGLVLGSGGFRGLAHIGVLKVLHQNNIPLDFIAGTSMGALFGGAYSATRDIEKIEKTVTRTGWIKGMFMLLDPAIFPHRGFLDGRGLEDFIYSFVQDKDFSETLIPFRCIACDLETGEEVILDKGKLVSAIRASMNVPFWFKPFFLDGKLLVDGDLTNPLPVNLARSAGCDIVIASSLTNKMLDISKRWSGIPRLAPIWKKLFGDKNYWKRHKYHFLSLLARTSNIIRQKMVQISLDQADIKITPQLSAKSIRWSKIYSTRHNMDRFIRIGERATEKVLPEIKKLLLHKWN